MPTISFFYGIAIRMFVRDHPPPHFHAIYGEHEAFIEISTGDIIQGKLPRAARRLVREWAELHRDELMANWHRREAGEPLERIPGLDADQGD
jgi:hypothetical protein